MERTYSTVEVCNLFGISRSTLFRWEREAWFPRVERDETGQRLYTNDHLRAIADYLRRRYKRQLEQAMNAEDRGRMLTIMRALSFVKFLQGRMEGLQELAEYNELPDAMVRQLLRYALEHYAPSDPEFCQIIHVLHTHCQKRNR